MPFVAPLPQVALLALEAFLVSALFVFVFRLRIRLGYPPLYVMVGALQFLQVVLSMTVYVQLTPNIAVSPGSAILLPATIFAVLLVYVADDASEARKLIYGVVLANVAIAVLGILFAAHLRLPGSINPLGVSAELFQSQARVTISGTAVLFMDVVLVILLYELVSRVVESMFVRLAVAGTVVLWIDTLAFVTAAFFGQENYGQLLLSGLVGKTVSSVLFAWVLYFFVVKRGIYLADRRAPVDGSSRDIFRTLSYRQRFEVAQREAFRDSLTGLYNRRFFDDALARELDRAIRTEIPLALLVLDIDHFKAVNDRFGHDEGDRALVLVGQAILEAVRGSDIACRIGGEEFAVVAPTAGEETAVRLANRIRERLAVLVVEARPPLPVDTLTVTVGVAIMPDDRNRMGEDTPEEFYRMADVRLYEGKQAGRDRVVSAGADAPTP